MDTSRCPRQVSFSMTGLGSTTVVCMKGHVYMQPRLWGHPVLSGYKTENTHPFNQFINETLVTVLFLFGFVVVFFLMKEGYRSFPEVTQPTSARTHLDLDKCQIQSRARIKIKHSLITQKLKNTCWAYLKYLNNTFSNCTLNCKIAFSISSMFPTQLKSSPGILNKDD